MSKASAKSARIVAVAASVMHSFSKPVVPAITLLAGLGVEGDAHSGVTVRHRSRVAVDPGRPNQRQVHLIHAELFEELGAKGHRVAPGLLGENVTTSDIDLLGLPQHARIHLGASAIVEVTGLRNPCRQLDTFQAGLMAALLDRDAAGRVVRKAGIMAIVVVGGVVAAGDRIGIELPAGPLRPLERV